MQPEPSFIINYHQCTVTHGHASILPALPRLHLPFISQALPRNRLYLQEKKTDRQWQRPLAATGPWIETNLVAPAEDTCLSLVPPGEQSQHTSSHAKRTSRERTLCAEAMLSLAELKQQQKQWQLKLTALEITGVSHNTSPNTRAPGGEHGRCLVKLLLGKAKGLASGCRARLQPCL